VFVGNTFLHGVKHTTQIQESNGSFYQGLCDGLIGECPSTGISNISTATPDSILTEIEKNKRLLESFSKTFFTTHSMLLTPSCNIRPITTTSNSLSRIENSAFNEKLKKAQITEQYQTQHELWIPNLARNMMKKHSRTKFSEVVRQKLIEWYINHTDNPFPTVDDKMMLSKQTGLSFKQLENWFVNIRRTSQQRRTKHRNVPWMQEYEKLVKSQ